MAEHMREIGVAVVAAMILAALAGGVAIRYFPNPPTASPQSKGSSTESDKVAEQFSSSFGAFVDRFQNSLMLDAQGEGGVGNQTAALLTGNLSSAENGYATLNLQFNLTFRGIPATFKSLGSEVVLVSKMSQLNSTVIDLNASDGAVICPADFSGFGSASWDGSSNTCTLTQTNPDVGPTLCLAISSGGCVTVPALRYVVDSGVTFDINITDSGVCVYSVLDNYGTVNFLNNPPEGLCDYGIVDNYGIMNLAGGSATLPYNGGGVINNFAGAVLTNHGALDNGGTINNFGTFVNENELEECVGGSPTVYGTLNNYGTVTSSGRILVCSGPHSRYDVYTISIETDPSTTLPAVYVNGTLEETPYSYNSGPGDVTNITAVATFGVSPSHLFEYWSNGAGRTQWYLTQGNATLTATYTP